MSTPDSFALMVCSTARRAVPAKSWGMPSRFGHLLEQVDIAHSRTNALRSSSQSAIFKLTHYRKDDRSIAL
jgi:hypothetical protein